MLNIDFAKFLREGAHRSPKLYSGAGNSSFVRMAVVVEDASEWAERVEDPQMTPEILDEELEEVGEEADQ